MGGLAIAGKPKSISTKEKMSCAKRGKSSGALNNFYGKHHSPETKLKIGAVKSIIYRGIGNPNYGKIWITSIDSIENKMIPKDSTIPKGWEKGRTLV